MNYEIQEFNPEEFNSLKILDENLQEVWLARELFSKYDYTEWRAFKRLINKAKRVSIFNPEGHFKATSKKVKIGSQALREIEDYQLTRYACYLIATVADSKKYRIRLAQEYFL